MSRFLKSMIVLLAIVAMATPVMAEDMLSLGGQMRVRGWYTDVDGSDSTNSFIDQRLRIGGKFNVADGVSVTFRTDFSEQQWGQNPTLGRTGWQLDRSYLDLDFSAFHLRAGQLYAGYGMTQVINSESTGAKLTLKAIPLSFFVLLQDANDAFASGDDAFSRTVNESDSFLYAANYTLKGDAFKANFVVGGQHDGSDENVNVFSGDMTMNLDAVKIAAELDFFTGDADATTDAMGTQFFLDAALAASETMTVGGQFYYAQGADTDGSEAQYTVLGNDFNGYDPLFDLGTSLSNEQIGVQRPFDFTDDNAGAIGARAYLKAKAGDAVSFGASIAYMEPEEDANTDIDSAMFYAVGMKYALMAHTSLHAQLQYTDLDINDPEAPDSITAAGVGLFVNF